MSEKKQTVINLVAKILSYGTTMLISFFLTPYLIARIGKEAYSFYPIANNFVNYMSVITVALNSMASRFITISLTQGDIKKANVYFVSVLYGNIIMSAILFIPLTAIVIFLEHILNIPYPLIASVKVLFALVFISMVVNLLTNVFGVAVFSQNRLELGSVCDIVVAIARVILYVLLFCFFKPNIAYVGVVALAVALLTMIIQYRYTQRLLPFVKINPSYFNKSAIGEVISSGVWNSVNQIGVTLLSTVGLMLCNILYGAADAADYSIALTIPQFLNGIVNMLSSVFYPGLTIKFARGNKKEVIKHVDVSQKIIGILVNIPTAIFMAIGINFFKLWTPTVDPQRLQILSLLAIGYLLITGVAWPISNLNTVMNKVKVPALVMLGTGVLNIIIVYCTYKFTNWGLYSIPLGQLILFILNRAFFVGAYSAHCLGEKWSLFNAAILKGILLAVVSFILTYIVNLVINPVTWTALVLECICVGLILLPIGGFIMFGKEVFPYATNLLNTLLSKIKANL